MRNDGVVSLRQASAIRRYIGRLYLHGALEDDNYLPFSWIPSNLARATSNTFRESPIIASLLKEV